MPADYAKRIDRLLRLLTLIQSETGWNAKRLAALFGVTERNIYRDLQVLEDANIPYSFDEETNGYRIRADFFMPAISLTLDEALALIALGQHIGGGEQVPYTKAAEKAITKVRCNLPRPVQDELDKVDKHLAIQLPAVNPPEAGQDVYGKVKHAISRGLAMECVYKSLSRPSHNGQPFLFKPYTLFFSRRAWYAVGHHSRAREVRSLKLSRFESCKLTDQAYKIPADFSLQKHLGNAWAMIKGQKTYEVELSFDEEFADTIADTHWHATQEVDWDEAGKTISFRCKVDGLDEIVWWILGMGPHCVVKQPKELAERVKELSQQTVKLYDP